MSLNKTDWIGIVKSFAPTIGTLLGGPLAGSAVGVLANVLLGDSQGGSEAVQKIINQGLTPDQLIAIKKADQEFKIKLKEMEFKIDELEIIDRSSARDREKVLGRIATIGVHSLGALILGGFFATVYWILTTDKSFNSETALIVGAMVGYVSSKADFVVAYFFGSSVGSKQKTMELADALQQSIKNKII